STAQQTQSIVVNTSGSYTVTIDGACQQWTSAAVNIDVADAPDAPTANGAIINYGATADLNATGSNVVWYDVATGGSAIASGNAFTTPALTATTSYWCADQNVSGGDIEYGGRTDQSNTGAMSNSAYHLLFDAFGPMVINSVKVYADGAGTRTIQLRDMSDNSTVAEGTFNIPDGESRVDLNFTVPAAGNYGLRYSSQNPGCWRDGQDGSIPYPFALGSLGSITGTNVTGGNALAYYYYFYDWEVQSPLAVCESARTEVVVEVGPQGINDGTAQGFSVYPVPTDAALTIDFGTIQGEVDLDLLDVTGRTVIAQHRTVNGPGQLDLGGLARGEYSLRVRHTGGQLVRRVVVR
ncbi:MAG TPA: T9SS type A sorting domain-containing protein, partial [Flavobacteriales bacterium]|nr:T9SS type A sorting domain-containing protein [Flavobacteriales bacterium]